jgi:hypothetical protein
MYKIIGETPFGDKFIEEKNIETLELAEEILKELEQEQEDKLEMDPYYLTENYEIVEE